MAAPNFPGKGAKPGMYTLPGGNERYYAGGNDFYRNAPGGGAQLFGELLDGSGWRGMSQFDHHNDGRSKGGVEAQNGNPFAPNFQAFYVPDDAPLRGIIGPNKADPNATPEPTVTAPSRDVPKANGAKGTQTSPGGGGPIIMTMADAANFYQSRGIGGFSSNQLPNTQTNPITGTTIEAMPFGGQETSVTGNSLGAYTSTNGQAYPSLDESKPGAKFDGGAQTIAGGAERIAATTNPFQSGKSYTEISPSDPIYAEAFGQDLADKNKGNSKRLNDALNDTAGMQSYMSKFGSAEDDRMRAANMAFLNADDSMMGLRAKEAVLGQMYAGGNHYQLNEGRTDFIKDKDGNNIAADKKATRAFKSGDMSAQDYRNTFTDAVMGIESKPTTPKQAENPNAQNPVPVAEQPINAHLGPLADVEEMTRRMETEKGLTGIGPYADGEAYGKVLEGRREPLMRDPRNK